MNGELKIENYLAQLDQELSALPISQRAEIITEIKSHILETTDKNPERALDSVLADLGQPSVVAERYLSAKGVARVPPKSGGWVKRLAIGFAVFFAAILILPVVLAMAGFWYLSPLIQVNESKGHVRLLGGLVDITEDPSGDQLKIGDLHFSRDERAKTANISGEMDLADQNVTLIKIPFNNGKLEVLPSADRKIQWQCKTLGAEEAKATNDAGIVTFNLDSARFAKCAFHLPSGTKTEIKGNNGKMEIVHPQSHMDVAMNNGKVEVKPDPSRVYDFQVKVLNGETDSFPHSEAKDAVHVNIDLVNGKVSKEE
jgi:hypothetical protein